MPADISAKPRQSAPTARAAKHAADNDDEDYSPLLNSRAAVTPRAPAGTKRPRAPPAKPKAKSKPTKHQLDELDEQEEEILDETGEGRDDVGMNMDEDEEEVEEIEKKPARRVKDSGIKGNPVLKQAVKAYKADERKKAALKKRAKEQTKSKIDQIYDQGLARMDAHMQEKGGFSEWKANILSKLADTKVQVTQCMEGNEVLAQVLDHHQAAIDVLLSSVDNFIKQRKACLDAVVHASDIAKEGTNDAQDRLVHFTFQRTMLEEEARAHNLRLFADERIGKAIRSALSWQ